MHSQRIFSILLVVLLLVGIGAGLSFLRNTPRMDIPHDVATTSDMSGTTTSGTMCAADVRQCPDGSFVHRVPPSCAFATCATPAPVTKTGLLIGKITTSPTCPVERIPPDPACAPRPYATDVTITPQSGGAPTFTHSGADGTFSARLQAGTYLVRVENGTTLPRCEEQTVTIFADATTSAAISCDTGIR